MPATGKANALLLDNELKKKKSNHNHFEQNIDPIKVERTFL